jgi:hypothetical protein
VVSPCVAVAMNKGHQRHKSDFMDDWYCGSFDCNYLLFGPAAFFDSNLPKRIGIEGGAR